MRFTYDVWLHHEPDNYRDFELDADGNERFSGKTHDAIHYAVYELKCSIEVDTEAETATITEIWDGDIRFVPS